MYEQENISNLNSEIEIKKLQISEIQKKFNQMQDIEQLKEDVILFLKEFVSICKNSNHELYVFFKRYFHVAYREKEDKFFVKFAVGVSFEITYHNVMLFHTVLVEQFLSLIKKEVKKNKTFKKEPQSFKAIIEDFSLKIEKFSEVYSQKKKEYDDEVAELNNKITKLENELRRLEIDTNKTKEKACHVESTPGTSVGKDLVKSSTYKEKSDKISSVKNEESINVCENQIGGAKKKLRKKLSKHSITEQIIDTTTKEEELFRDFSKHKEKFLQNPYLILNLDNRRKDLSRIFLKYKKLLFEKPEVVVKLLSKNEELVRQYHFPISELLRNVFSENNIEVTNDVKSYIVREDKKIDGNLETNLMYCQIYENIQFFVQNTFDKFKNEIGKDNFFKEFSEQLSKEEKLDLARKLLLREVFSKITYDNFKLSMRKVQDAKDAFHLSIKDLRKNIKKVTKIFGDQKSSVMEEIEEKLVPLVLNAYEILLLLNEFLVEKTFICTSDDILKLISKNDNWFLDNPKRFLALLLISRNLSLPEFSFDKALNILSKKCEGFDIEEFLKESGIFEDKYIMSNMLYIGIEDLCKSFYNEVIDNFKERIRILAKEIVSSSGEKFELYTIKNVVKREVFDKISFDNLFTDIELSSFKLSKHDKKRLQDKVIEYKNKVEDIEKDGIIKLLLAECCKIQDGYIQLNNMEHCKAMEEEKLDNFSKFKANFPIAIEHNVSNELPSNEVTYSNVERCNSSSKFPG